MPSLLDNDLSQSFLLTFAGIPFITDKASVFRSPGHTPHGQEGAERNFPPRDQQPLADLIDEIDRLIPFNYLQDFSPASDYPGRNLGAIARKMFQGPFPNPKIRIGDWYYPTGASRWSVFRGLATSGQVKKMMKQTAGHVAATFTMYQNPFSPSNPNFGNAVSVANYTLTSKMYMLPPRPLGETAGKFDGLYLVTLVDERYYWQRIPVSLAGSLRLDSWNATDWLTLINNVLNTLGVGPADASQLPPTYAASGPELDSQLWTNFEPAPIVLDALCANIGRTLVRSLEGTYSVLMPGESAATAATNRGIATKVFRTAGGDMFVPSGSLLPVGGLSQSPNAVIPANVTVSFPKYVAGKDPVPHFSNPRYENQRPSAWYEESYGDTASVKVPIINAGPQIWSSGALNSGAPVISGVITPGGSASGLTSITSGALSGSFVSGATFLSGVVGIFSYNHVIHDTAKALYSTEASLGGTPANASGLTALAQQIAQDFYASQVAAALDETYPGTFAWTPEGIHDIVWTYSERARGAFTRVLRTQWNNFIGELQHGTPPDSSLTFTANPPGVGGPSVAQTWRDSFSGIIATQVLASGSASPGLGFTGVAIPSGDLFARFADISYFPTQNRWRGTIDNEEFLFEGTSGGIEAGNPSTTNTNCCICVEMTGNLPAAGSCDSAALDMIFAGSGLFIPSISGGCQWAQAQSGLNATLIMSGNNASLIISQAGGIGFGCSAIYRASGVTACDGMILDYDPVGSVRQSTLPISLACVAGPPSPVTTSGNPVSGGYRVDIAYRGIDGTLEASHNSGAAVFWDTSDRAYGVNLVTQEKMHWAFPHEWTSGGMLGVREVPVLQSMKVFENVGTVLNGITHYSGAVYHYDTTQSSGNVFIQEELIWAVERNNQVPLSGSVFGGQFAGFSKIPQAAPVYLFEAGGACSCTSGSSSITPPACCPCKEFDFSITGLDPTTCGGNGAWALTQQNSCNCCMWCSVSTPDGGKACITLKPGPVGSLGVLEICTADNCCATYRGLVSDCNNFTLNLCDTCGSGGAGWPGSVTITCGCLPGTCNFCTTSSGAPGSFTVNVPGGFFSTSPLSLFNNTNWTLTNTKPCIWNQCQTDPTTNDLLCMTLTILGPANSQLLLQVFSPSGTGPPLASILFTDNTDPIGGDCCSNNFVFSASGGNNCCTCSTFQILFPSGDVTCYAITVSSINVTVQSNPCCWQGVFTGGNTTEYLLCQTPGSNSSAWTLVAQDAAGISDLCRRRYTGTSTNCNSFILHNTLDSTRTAVVTCTAGGGGGGSAAGMLTAVPVCCGLQQVTTPCCPANKINKRLHAKVQLTSVQPCPIRGVIVTLNWFKGGTGPCPGFSGPNNFDYWFGTAPTSGDTSLVLLMYCDTIHGTPTWKLFGVCTTAPPDCSVFANAFTLNNFFTPIQPADCSIPTIVFGLGSIGASCCGVFGGTGTITVTD